MGEYGHKIEDVYNAPSIDRWEARSNQQDFGATFEGLQLEASQDMGQKYGIYTTFL